MRISDWSSDVCSSDLEAGVAILRRVVAALRFAERAVEAVDRDERQAVGVDEIRHLADRHLRREQFCPFGRIDAVKAAMLRRRARDAHMHFGCAGIAHHLHDLEARRAAHDRIRSEEHTSELQSLMRNSYAVFCLKKKKRKHKT